MRTNLKGGDEMNEKIEDIIREMRSVGDYSMYRKPVFSSPKFVSPSYINHFMRSPDGLYFGETIFVEEPRVVEVNVYELADRIEKAYNYQRRDGSLCTMSCRESGELLNQYMEENKKLHEENKRLRTENERLKVCKDFLYT